jgi:hypothetical protein
LRHCPRFLCNHNNMQNMWFIKFFADEQKISSDSIIQGFIRCKNEKHSVKIIEAYNVYLCTFVIKYTAKNKCIKFYRIKEQSVLLMFDKNANLNISLAIDILSRKILCVNGKT